MMEPGPIVSEYNKYVYFIILWSFNQVCLERWWRWSSAKFTCVQRGSPLWNVASSFFKPVEDEAHSINLPFWCEQQEKWNTGEPFSNITGLNSYQFWSVGENALGGKRFVNGFLQKAEWKGTTLFGYIFFCVLWFDGNDGWLII